VSSAANSYFANQIERTPKQWPVDTWLQRRLQVVRQQTEVVEVIDDTDDRLSQDPNVPGCPVCDVKFGRYIVSMRHRTVEKGR
jgi:hypothetical protein